MRTTWMLGLWHSLVVVCLTMTIGVASSTGQENVLFSAPQQTAISAGAQAASPTLAGDSALSTLSAFDIPKEVVDANWPANTQSTGFEGLAPADYQFVPEGGSVAPQFTMPEAIGVPCEEPAADPCCECGDWNCTGLCTQKCTGCGSLCGERCCPIWGRFEVLGWALSGYSTPALVTGSPFGTPQSAAGVLGNPATSVLFGNRNFGNDVRLGGRFTGGFWFDSCRRIGLQGDFFSLGSDNDNAFFSSNGSNTLARPFFNTDPNVNAQDAQIFAMPGLADGSLRISTSSDIISAGPALRFNLCCCQDECSNRSKRTDFLAGYRYFRIEEEFAAQEILMPTDGLFAMGTRFELNDRITTTNEFHGFEFGLNHMFQRGRWLWDIQNTLAVGQVRRVVQLDGSTRTTVPGILDETFPGGFFVGAGDVGRFVDNDVAVIPQVRAHLSYCIGNNWRIGAGYNFLYLSSLFRPNSFLDTTINGSQLGRPPVVGVVNNSTIPRPRQSAFLHGVSVSATYNF